MEAEKLKPAAFATQVIAAMAIAYLTSLTGFISAWPSYTVTNFMSNDTHLSAPMTPIQNSLLGSLPNVGALIATPLCGYAMDKLGRKYAAMLFGLPYVLCWAIIILTDNVHLILFAMGAVGFGAAGQAVSSVFICEIAHDSIRGGLASFCVSGYYVGILVSYVLGGRLPYRGVLRAHLALSALYLALLALLRESPVYLMQRGREKEAMESIKFYRRYSITSKEMAHEIAKLKQALDPCLDKILRGDEEIEVVEELLKNYKSQGKVTTLGGSTASQQTTAWRFLWESKSSKRALLTVIVLMSLSILMGSLALQIYAEPLMREAAPSVPSNLATILLAVDLLIASLICGVVVERYGRKPLMTYSALTSAVFALLLGVQLQLNFFSHWVTVGIIYGYTFAYTIGAATVPFILTAEVFLPEVRGLCNSICMGCMWLMNFVIVVVFNLSVPVFGLGMVFCFFALVCFIGAVYSHLCLPETKGLSTDEIQFQFYKQKKRKSLAA